jgi:hypothetical protein
MFRSETKTRCTLDKMTCINIVLLMSNTHILFLLYILIMDILINSSVLGRIYHTLPHRYGMVHKEHWQRTIGRQQGVDMLVAGDATCPVIW